MILITTEVSWKQSATIAVIVKIPHRRSSRSGIFQTEDDRRPPGAYEISSGGVYSNSFYHIENP